MAGCVFSLPALFHFAYLSPDPHQPIAGLSLVSVCQCLGLRGLLVPARLRQATAPIVLRGVCLAKDFYLCWRPPSLANLTLAQSSRTNDHFCRPLALKSLTFVNPSHS